MKLTDDLWRELVLSPIATIQNCIENLNKNSLKIVLIANENGELLGTISDGDIRRALLKGFNLSSKIDGIVRRDALVVPPDLPSDLVRRLMVANKITQIPIVDESMRVIGLHLWDELSENSLLPNWMVIMAGGQGKRLMPLTANCPKPLLHVAGKPILERIIERAKESGFRKFVISINYLGHMIEDYFGDGSKFDVEIKYLNESKPLGTVGAISLLSSKPTESIIVTNGDVISDINFREILNFHERNKSDATMAVSPYEWQHPYGVVHLNNIDIIGFEEKPVTKTHINAGVYVLGSKSISLLEPGVYCDMPSLFERAKADGRRVIAYPMHEPWLDVGRINDFQLANTLDFKDK